MSKYGHCLVKTLDIMEAVYESPYLKCLLHAGKPLIELVWLPASADMDDTGYYENLTAVIDLLREHRPKLWLGDTRQLNFTIGPELQDWNANVLNPEILAVGLEKMALVLPEELIANLSVQQSVEEMEVKNTKGGQFTTRYFDNRQDALAWVAG